MLSLGRRSGEFLVLPQLGIKFCWQRQRDGSVRVKIQAPNNIKVVRGELIDDRTGLPFAEPLEDVGGYRDEGPGPSTHPPLGGKKSSRQRSR